MTITKKLNLDSVVQRYSDLIDAEVDEDIVMVNVETGFYYAVADVAREIWQAIEHPTKISDLIDHLAATYDVNRSACEEQTLSFLEGLLAERLLRETQLESETYNQVRAVRNWLYCSICPRRPVGFSRRCRNGNNQPGARWGESPCGCTFSVRTHRSAERRSESWNLDAAAALMNSAF